MGKNKRRVRQEALQLSDLGTEETRQRGEAKVLTMRDGSQQVKVAYVTNQWSIDRMLKHGTISQRQFDAGLRLKTDLYDAGLSDRITVNLAAALGVSGGSGEISDTACAARIRVRHAMQALDPDSRLVISYGVILDYSCADIASKMGMNWRQRAAVDAGKQMIRAALEKLADHYGMAMGD